MIRLAIYLTSPALYNSLNSYSKLDKKKQKRSESALYRYIARMTTRCTPFGLFSGTATTVYGGQSSILLNDETKFYPYLESQIAITIGERITHDEALREQIRYYPNPTIYRICDQYNYIGINQMVNSYNSVVMACKRSTILDCIIQISSDGQRLVDLIDHLVMLGYERDDCVSLVNKLIEIQFLTNIYQINISGLDYFSRLSEFIHSCDQKRKFYKSFDSINSALEKISVNLDDAFPQLSNLKSDLTVISGDPNDINDKTFLCIDHSRGVVSECSSLSKSVQNKINSCLTFLNSICYLKQPNELNRFKDAYQECYGDREMKLSDVLDPERGIGYPAFNNIPTSSEDIICGFANQENGSISKPSELETILWKVITKENEAPEINLSTVSFPAQQVHHGSLPFSTCVFFTLVHDQPRREILHLISASTLLSCNVLSRLSNSDQSVKDLCKYLMIKDSQLADLNGLRIAEILYAPTNRALNVMYHNNSLKWEIPLGMQSLLSSNRIITYNELLVSIRGDKVVLRTSSDSRPIIPTTNNAIDYSSSPLSIFRFLCDVGNQYFKQDLYLDTQYLRSHLPHVPRITYNNTILSPESWLLCSDNLMKISLTEDDKVLSRTFCKLFEEMQIPSRVYIEEGDNRLFLDINIPNSIRSAIPILRSHKTNILSEFLYRKDHSIVKDQRNEGYMSELMTFIYSDTQQ